MNRRRFSESHDPLPVLLVVTGTGPSPIGRPFAEMATDGVIVDVRNRSFNGLPGSEIPIITSAFLPESKTVDSGPLADGQPFQERTPNILQSSLDSSGKRGLDRLPQQVDSDIMGSGRNKDMNVLWHENVSDQSARLSEESPVETFGQELSPFVVPQERQPAVA